MRRPLAALIVFGLAGVASPWRTGAQELEPRTYSPNPVGMNFVAVAVGRSRGDVVFDPALPVEDVDAHLTSAALAYGHTFGVFDRTTTLAFAVPYVSGNASGAVGGTRDEVHRAGLGDARLRLGVSLFGGPALTPEEFARRTPHPVVGASVVVVAPTGQYDGTHLINIGSNRWAFKPEIGVSYPIGRFFVEGYAGVWLFTDNDDYLGGSRRSQDPLATFQAHVSYTVRRGLWIAADATHYSGGRTQTNDVQRSNRQSNTRVGLTLSLPLEQGQSLKLVWSEGTTVRFGGDFRTLSIAWQRAWLK